MINITSYYSFSSNYIFSPIIISYILQASQYNVSIKNFYKRFKGCRGQSGMRQLTFKYALKKLVFYRMKYTHVSDQIFR